MVLLVGCSQKETENQKLDGPRRKRGVDGIFRMYDNSPCFYHSSWDNYAATQQAYSIGGFSYKITGSRATGFLFHLPFYFLPVKIGLRFI